MTDWQPIKTAPKDGTTIIGWDRYHQEPATYRWGDDGRFLGWEPVHEGSHIIEAQGDWGTDYKEHSPLSHWQPLPEPPNE